MVRMDMKTGREITLEEQIEQLRMEVWTLQRNCKDVSDIVWKLVNQLNEHIEDEKRKD
jgi:chaperonin cofactor prefoldin